jgi:acetoacetate decarboxylase
MAYQDHRTHLGVRFARNLNAGPSSSSRRGSAHVRASLAAAKYQDHSHVDGTPRICELVEYHLNDFTIKGAWTGPAALHLSPHALAPVAELPVLEIVSAIHILGDLTLGLGKVVHDYLQQPGQPSRRLNEMALMG